jgi:hypothetical protein
VLNKDVLTQAEVLVALRTIAPQDRNAIDEWIKVHGTPKQREELMQSLPSLPVGTAWFWSPGWLDIFSRVKVRKRRTFDSSATPKVGQKIRPPKKLAEVDLTQLRDRIAATVERVKAEDPIELRKRVMELQKQLHLSQRVETKIERVEVPVLHDQEIELLMQAVSALSITGNQLEVIAREISEALRSADEIKHRGDTRSNGFSSLNTDTRIDGGQIEVKALTSHSGWEPVGTYALGEEKISGGERKILAALANYPQGRTKTQVAILTGYSHRGGAFNNYLSALRTKGFIDRDGYTLKITNKGLAAGPYEKLPTGKALAGYWLSQLGRAERLILQTLLEAYPMSLSKEEVAYRAGYEVRGGGFNNAVSKLRTLELIHGRGELRASDNFFEGSENKVLRP